jgi:hypothetical protein
MAKRKKKAPLPKKNKYYDLLADELKLEVPDSATITSLTRGQREKLDKGLHIRTTPITWGIPFDEILFAKFFTFYIRLNQMPWDNFATSESTYLPDARNEIHNNFLDLDCEYLMMLDSDVLCPPGMVEVLMSHNKHLVGGWYKNKAYHKEPHPIVYDFVDETETLNFKPRQEPGTGLERVDGMGAGCWLMSQELAQALGKSPYSLEKGGEDLCLSKKVMDLGYEMWVDWDMACAHVGVSWV